MPIPPSTKKISDSGLTAKGEPRQFVKHSYTDRAIEEDGPLSKKDETSVDSLMSKFNFDDSSTIEEDSSSSNNQNGNVDSGKKENWK